MDELKELEKQLTTGIVEMPSEKGHYITVREYTKEVPTYDENGIQTGTQTVVTGREQKWVWTAEEELEKQRVEEDSKTLKAELAKIKEDIEQETFGLIRDDFVEKKARAAAIINELRVLEGKEPRKIQ